MTTAIAPRRRRLTAPKIAPYLFILPNMLVFSIFTIWPAVSGFNLSFFDSSDGLKFKSVGTGNYKEILSDSEFWDAARATAIYTVGFVLISAVLATALGLLLNAQRKGRGAISAAYFLPVLISPVVVGVIWQAALDRNTGLVNQALSSVGLGHPGWLINSKLALVAVIFVGTWIHLGFYTMIILSGLQGIDTSVYEAAKLDGASEWQKLRTITLPLLRPTMMVVIILATITGFQSFDFIYTLTGGGPIGATTLIVQYIYEHAFSTPIQYGLASAAGVILFIVVFAITLLNYGSGRRRDAI